MEASGRITQIVRGSYLDGPGLRTVVFLKGCPLRCGWCHNPETQRSGPEVLFDSRRCMHCGQCVAACPNGAISLDHPTRIERHACDGRHQCVEVCPTAALRPAGVRMTVGEVMSEIAKDRLFYSNSGGGVTFSGGEPLQEPGFLASLLSECRKVGVSTAVDTCLAVPWSNIEPALPLVDLFLVDLKHSQEPSVQPELVFNNARKLTEAGARVWLRIPVIPGWNDTLLEMERLAAFAGSLRGRVESAHLLPFHATAEMKYKYLGREWDYVRTPEIPDSLVESIRRLFEAHGVRTVVSGAPA